MSDLYGWNGKLIDVDLSQESIKIKDIPKKTLKKYMGCRSLSSK